jgi:hypothetical protein
MNYINRYKELEKYILGQRRFKFIKKLSVILIIILMFLVLKYTYNQELKLSNYNQYLNYFNSFLTLALLIVTTVYVFYSKKIVDLTREKSQTDIIPKIWIFPENPKIGVSKFAQSETTIEFKIKVHNFGNSPAISSKISFSIPNEDHKIQEVSFCEYSLNEFPNVLNPGSSTENVMVMHAFFPIKSIKDYKKSFLSIRLVFEDFDRNYHTINQYYDLIVDFDNKYFSWNILLDEHYYYPRHKRKSTYDSSSLGYLTNDHVLVYRKTNIFSMYS